MLNINDALKAIGLGLLVLFFAVGVVKTCSSAVSYTHLALREKTAAGDPAGAGPEEGGTGQAAPA